MSTTEIAVQDTPRATTVEGPRTLFETILSGAVGGALWGAVSGSLAGFGVVRLTTLGLDYAPLAIREMAWAETALSAMLAGTFVGAMLGMFLGWGVYGGDAYLFSQSRRGGQVLLRVQTDQARADEVRQVLSQVNRDAGSQARRVTV